MTNIKELNIWKKEDQPDNKMNALLAADISELNLSVRSFNCLKRAGCNTIGDVLKIQENEDGLIRIRNLGRKSLLEITSQLAIYREAWQNQKPQEKPMRKLIKPAKKIWDREVSEFGLSGHALLHLQKCGVCKVEDLYRAGLTKEPGWYAVRELFEKIPFSS